MRADSYAALFVACCSLLACQRSPHDEAPKTERESASAEKPRSQQKAKLNTEQKAQANPAPPSEPAQPRAESPSPTKKRYVVAALGDSITDAQVGGGGYLKVLRAKCPESEFVNFGKGGDMTNQMRWRFESDVRPQIPTLQLNTLLVYGGVNDLYSDLTAGRVNDRIEEDLTAIYRSARAAGLQVVAVTVSPWGGFSKYFNPRRGKNTRLLNSWIMGQVASGLVDKAVDSFAVLSCGDEDVLCPKYETRFHDGLHPGEEGHAILGQKLFAEAFADCL